MFIQISLGQEGQGQCVMRAVGMGGTIREALRAGHGGCLALLHVLGHLRDSRAVLRVYRVPYTWAYKSRAWKGACYMYLGI